MTNLNQTNLMFNKYDDLIRNVIAATDLVWLARPPNGQLILSFEVLPLGVKSIQ